MQVWLQCWRRSHDHWGQTCNFRAGLLSFNGVCIAFTTALDAEKFTNLPMKPGILCLGVCLFSSCFLDIFPSPNLNVIKVKHALQPSNSPFNQLTLTASMSDRQNHTAYSDSSRNSPPGDSAPRSSCRFWTVRFPYLLYGLVYPFTLLCAILPLL